MAIKLKRLVVDPRGLVEGFHLSQIQDNIDLSLSQVSNSPFFSGVFVVTDLVAGGADNTINHGLDRKVQGWTIVSKNAQADLWESPTVNKLPNKQIILRTSNAVTVKLYLF